MNKEDYKNAYDSVIIANKMLEQEIERLQEDLDYHKKGFAELHKRIDEAIDYIDNLKNEWNDCSGMNNISLYLFEAYVSGISKMITIKEILKGNEDNEKDSNKRTSEI